MIHQKRLCFDRAAFLWAEAFKIERFDISLDFVYDMNEGGLSPANERRTKTMSQITCDDPELHVSRGPVSSLPGSSHALPKGAMCDMHSTVPAVARIQGETDSFGAEYNLMCQACLDADRKATREAYGAESYCDWCKTMKTHCSPRRDFEEGMGGPVYNVCRDCVSKENARIDEELDARDDEDDRHYIGDRYDQDGDDDDLWPEDDEEEDTVGYHDEVYYASREDKAIYRSSRHALPVLPNGGVVLVSQMGRE